MFAPLVELFIKEDKRTFDGELNKSGWFLSTWKEQRLDLIKIKMYHRGDFSFLFIRPHQYNYLRLDVVFNSPIWDPT